jgi:rhodanese-related sulfurtransferase
MKFITARDLKNKMDAGQSICVIDIREPFEYQFCNIGSLHIPMAELPDKIHEIPSHEMIVLMCKSGKRAEAVGNLISVEKGIEVFILEGGITAWKDEVDNLLELD